MSPRQLPSEIVLYKHPLQNKCASAIFQSYVYDGINIRTFTWIRKKCKILRKADSFVKKK